MSMVTYCFYKLVALSIKFPADVCKYKKNLSNKKQLSKMSLNHS